MATTETKRTTPCPTCGAPTAPRPEGDGERTFPFCTRRCRTLDLGNWLDERYRLGDDEEMPRWGED